MFHCSVSVLSYGSEETFWMKVKMSSRMRTSSCLQCNLLSICGHTAFIYCNQWNTNGIALIIVLTCNALLGSFGSWCSYWCYFPAQTFMLLLTSPTKAAKFTQSTTKLPCHVVKVITDCSNDTEKKLNALTCQPALYYRGGFNVLAHLWMIN